MFERISQAVRKDISGICRVYERSFREITTVGTGGTPLAVAEPETPTQVLELLHYLERKGIKWFVLGGGSKVVFPDGFFEAVVIRPALRYIKAERRDDFFEVTAGAGVKLADIVSLGAKLGFDGVFALSGIPGTLGGAVFMNAGTRDGEIGDFLVDALLLDENLSFVRAKPKLGYRSSDIGRKIVIEVRLRFRKADPFYVRRKVKSYLAYRRRTQPVNSKNFGCMFKNPSPSLSAGKIIDELGLKGFSVGKVKVSYVHANFVENDGVSSSDVVELIMSVEKKVRERAGILLEREVIIVT